MHCLVHYTFVVVNKMKFLLFASILFISYFTATTSLKCYQCNGFPDVAWNCSDHQTVYCGRDQNFCFYSFHSKDKLLLPECEFLPPDEKCMMRGCADSNQCKNGTGTFMVADTPFVINVPAVLTCCQGNYCNAGNSATLSDRSVLMFALFIIFIALSFKFLN